MKPILSFCISTCNRGQRAKALVDSILASTCQDFELIITNNGSEDETHALLSSISDPRYKYHKNEINIGTVSVVYTLFKATGDYCVVVSDDDLVSTENIEIFCNFLKKHPPLSVVLPSIETYNHDRGQFEMPIGLSYENNLFSCGFDALSQMSFFHTYLTGIIVNTELLKSCTSVEDIVENGGKVGHVYWKDKLLMQGNGATMVAPLFKTNIYLEECWSDSSHFINDNNTCILLPTRRLWDVMSPLFTLCISLENQYNLTFEQIGCLYVRLLLNCLFEIEDAMGVASQMEVKHKGYKSVVLDLSDAILLCRDRFIDALGKGSKNYGFIAAFCDALDYYFSREFDNKFLEFLSICSDMQRRYIVKQLGDCRLVLERFNLISAREAKRIGEYKRAEELFYSHIGYCENEQGIYNGTNLDNNVYMIVSCKFHLGEMKYWNGQYSEAGLFFSECISLTGNRHKVAGEYLRKIKNANELP